MIASLTLTSIDFPAHTFTTGSNEKLLEAVRFEVAFHGVLVYNTIDRLNHIKEFQ